MKRSPLAIAATAALNLLLYQVSFARAEIRSVEHGQPTAVADNAGDTWVSAWAKNGAVYTPSDDTDGFRKIGSGNLAFNRDGDKTLFVFTAGDWNNPEVYRLTVVPIFLRD